MGVGRINQGLDNLLELIGFPVTQQRSQEIVRLLIAICRLCVQGGQCRRIRLVLAGFGLAQRPQAEFVEQYATQLLGALQVHFAAGCTPCDFLSLCGIGGKLVAHGHQTRLIDARPRVLHPVKHLGNRQFERTQQPVLLALVQRCGQPHCKLPDGSQFRGDRRIIL